MISDAWCTAGGEPLSFLKSFRQRGLLRWFLFPCCLAAAVLNEAVRWSTVGLNLWRGLDLPVLEVGPVFVLVAMFATAHRWRPDYTAARADRQLAFQDRFTSLIDFAGRGDLSPAVRAAQGAEVGAALAGRSVRAALPLRPLLFAGPLLLLGSMLYPFFLPSSPVGLLTLVRRVNGPEKNRNLRSDGTLDMAGDAPRPVPSARGKDAPAGNREKSVAKPDSPQGQPAANRDNGSSPDKEYYTPPRGNGPRKTRIGEGPLVSERIGSRLTRVINPLFQEDATRSAPPEQPAGGAIAFRLLPKSGTTGAGEGSGSGENPEAVTLNLDAVPEAYRQLVKNYFTLLAGKDRKD